MSLFHDKRGVLISAHSVQHSVELQGVGLGFVELNPPQLGGAAWETELPVPGMVQAQRE